MNHMLESYVYAIDDGAVILTNAGLFLYFREMSNRITAMFIHEN